MGLNSIMAGPLWASCLLVCVGAADIHQLRGGPLLNNTVIQRSMDELNIAKNAAIQAVATGKAARTQQENYVAHETIQKAMEAYDQVREKVPEARAAVLETKKYAMMARQHADHTLEVEEETRKIPDIAAERAKEAVKGWIKSEAEASAEASAVSPKEFAKIKADKIAEKVAAAAEPYHLALLRNQKFATEAYAKAKAAQQSSTELQTKAKDIASKAQEMQAAGLGVDAQDMMSQAHALMREGENMRQWSLKLYDQANTAHSTAGGYTVEEQQAAKNAAMTAVVNAPMKLPPAAL